MVSLRSEDQAEGGFLADSDVRLISHKFAMFDYNGAIPDPIPALRVEIEVEGADEPRIEWYSAGSAERLLPSNDGKKPAKEGITLCSVGEHEAKGLSKSSKAGMYIAAIEAAGAEATEGDVSIWDGLYVHVDQRPDKVRSGLKDQREGKTILLVTAILDAPKGAKGGAKGKKGPSVDDEAVEAIAEVLGKKQHKKGIDRDDLSKELFQELKGNPSLKAIVKLVNDDDWVSDDDRPWEYNSKTDTLVGG